jgi:hypothetical protein
LVIWTDALTIFKAIMNIISVQRNMSWFPSPSKMRNTGS